MKKILLAVFAIAILTAFAIAETQQNTGTSGQSNIKGQGTNIQNNQNQDIMKNLDRNYSELKPIANLGQRITNRIQSLTGTAADASFLKQMTVSHDGANVIYQMIQMHSADQDLVSYAKSKLDESRNEIDQMATTWRDLGFNSLNQNQLKDDNNLALDQDRALLDLKKRLEGYNSSDINKHLIASLIQLNIGGADLANAAKNKVQDQRVKDLANKMAQDHQAEVTKLNDMLKNTEQSQQTKGK